MFRAQIMEWTDASKKLPDMRKMIDMVSDQETYVFQKSEEVLVYADGQYDIAYYTEEEGEGGSWVGWKESSLNVTHWMPLPPVPDETEGYKDAD